jgi:cytochrome c-type biogenesis protein CcmH/NrfF
MLNPFWILPIPIILFVFVGLVIRRTLRRRERDPDLAYRDQRTARFINGSGQ